jgi:hypothetical protein
MKFDERSEEPPVSQHVTGTPVQFRASIDFYLLSFIHFVSGLVRSLGKRLRISTASMGGSYSELSRCESCINAYLFPIHR